MYRICEVNSSKFICDVQIQDGEERTECTSREKAIESVIKTAKFMNHTDITEKDIKFSTYRDIDARIQELEQALQDIAPKDDFDKLAQLVKIEYTKAVAKFGPFKSNHEGYAILKEEVDELWDGIKKNDNKLALKEEALQIAAMAIRFCVDL